MFKFKRFGISIGLLFIFGAALSSSGCYAVGKKTPAVCSSTEHCSFSKHYGQINVVSDTRLHKWDGEVLDENEAICSTAIFLKKGGVGKPIVGKLHFGVKFDKEGTKESNFFKKIRDKVFVVVTNGRDERLAEGKGSVVYSLSDDGFRRFLGFGCKLSDLEPRGGMDALKGLQITVYGGKDLNEVVLYTKFDGSDFRRPYRLPQVLSSNSESLAGSTYSHNLEGMIFGPDGKMLKSSEAKGEFACAREVKKVGKEYSGFKSNFDFKLMFDKEGSESNVFKNVGSKLAYKVFGGNGSMLCKGTTDVLQGKDGFAKKVELSTENFELKSVEDLKNLEGMKFYFYDVEDLSRPLFYVKTHRRVPEHAEGEEDMWINDFSFDSALGSEESVNSALGSEESVPYPEESLSEFFGRTSEALRDPKYEGKREEIIAGFAEGLGKSRDSLSKTMDAVKNALAGSAQRLIKDTKEGFDATDKLIKEIDDVRDECFKSLRDMR